MKRMFEPNQIILINGELFKVTANCLGSVNQVNLVGIVSMNKKPGSDAAGRTLEELYVPESILIAACAEHAAGHYAPVEPDTQKI